MNEFPQLQRLFDAPGAPLSNWREIVALIVKEFESAKSEESRVTLLAALTAAMDTVQTTWPHTELAAFLATRRLQYDALVMHEALMDGSVCAETLDAITKREIAAGRMAPNSALRKIAERGLNDLRWTRIAVAKPKNFWQRAWARLFG